MGTVSTTLTTFEDFIKNPGLQNEDGSRSELHDGEVVAAPPKPGVGSIATKLVTLINKLGKGKWIASSEFSYRPASNLQYWVAGVGLIPRKALNLMAADAHTVYAPPLIVEILTTGNRTAKIRRQRVVAFGAGTQEFWVIDPKKQTVEVSLPGQPSVMYGVSDAVPVCVLGGVTIHVADLF